MAERKRKHDEFAHDLRKSSVQQESVTSSNALTTSPDMDTTNSDEFSQGVQSGLPDRGVATSTTNDDDQWQISLSKKARKKQRKREEAEQEPLGPSLFYHNKILNPLRIKDLQAMVLYTLSDGVAPTWVALKNAKQIEQVVVVMVPGMDKPMISTFASAAQDSSDNQTGSLQLLKFSDDPATSARTPEEGHSEDQSTVAATDSTPKALPNSTLTDCIIPVKAPGDSKTGKIHSPLQGMLISPEPKTNKGSYKGADNVLTPVRTPLVHFVHAADELVEAQYPVHQALFTNPEDAQLEKSRRQGAGQSLESGWVDAKVTSSVPSPQVEPGSDDLAQGVDVYALDCEMVLTTDDVYSLARISVLDWRGKTVLDKIVKPALPVKDYFTQFSGITEKLLEGVTTTLEDVQQGLLQICTPSTILLGHSLESDLNALKFAHPFVVDTAIIYPHPRGLPLRSSLKFLANKYLKREIQKGGADGHDSVEDARAVLDLVKLKCEKGPKWGTMDVNGESIFARLERSGCRTAIVEHGTPEKGLGRLANLHVGCQNDDEIVDGLVNIMGKDGAGEKVNFVWGRLREMERARGCNTSSVHHADTPTSHNGEGVNGDDDSKLQKATTNTMSNLLRIYRSLAPSTLFMALPGPGDMREMNRLHEMQKQYRREFKVKKWDELTVKWTDDEIQALKKATEQARNGWAIVCLK